MPIQTNFSADESKALEKLGARPLTSQAEYQELTKNIDAIPTSASGIEDRTWWVFDGDLTLEGESAEIGFRYGKYGTASVIVTGDLIYKDHGYWEVGGQAIFVLGSLIAPNIIVENHLYVGVEARFEQMLLISCGGYETQINRAKGPLCIRTSDAASIDSISNANVQVFVDQGWDENVETFGDHKQIMDADLLKGFLEDPVDDYDEDEFLSYEQYCVMQISFTNGQKADIVEGKLSVLK